jgi:hypothetical protein
MVPPESLSQYLSNEYQCYGVSIESKITNNFLHSGLGDKSRPPSIKGLAISIEKLFWTNGDIIGDLIIYFLGRVAFLLSGQAARCFFITRRHGRNICYGDRTTSSISCFVFFKNCEMIIHSAMISHEEI